MNELKERNIWIIGTSGDAPKTLYQVDLKAPVALVLEVRDLDEAIQVANEVLTLLREVLIGEAMHASQETLRLLLDAMEDRVYVVTDDYRIVYANRKMMQGLCGDIATDYCYKVCRGLDQRCEDCSTDKVFDSDSPIHKEFFNVRCRGGWFARLRRRGRRRRSSGAGRQLRAASRSPSARWTSHSTPPPRARRPTPARARAPVPRDTPGWRLA